MSQLTLKGLGAEVNILEGTIALPRYGVWTADLWLDTETTAGLVGVAGAASPVTIQAQDGTVAFKGTIVAPRAGIEFKSLLCRVIGGNIGMTVSQPPKFYQSVPLQVPLLDILAGAGEALSPTADQGVLNFFYAKWTRNGTITSNAISNLLDDTNATWRVLNDGTLWVGNETFPPFDPKIDFQYLGTKPQEGHQTISMATPMLIPGVTFNNVKVSYVQHEILAEQVRTEFWYELT